MKKANFIITVFAVIATVIVYSCKKEDKIDQRIPVISLSPEKFLGKSGQELSITLNVIAPNGISDLEISKGVNLEPDKSFGENGLMKVDATGNSFEYVFKYVLQPEEVDKLVGFNFKVKDSQGLSAEKDFTLNTTVSGAQLLYSYRWNLKTKVWQSNPPAEDSQVCERDDSYLFNRDSTMAMNYGASACTFDGFNVYTKWTLSPDEKELAITYQGLFNPEQVTVDKYRVISLTKEKLVIEIAYDLTVFGLTDHEVYVFTYEASSR